MPCTTLLVGKNASYDGSTIVARNEDSEEGQFNPKRFAVVTPSEQPRHYRSVLSHVEIDLPENPLRYTSLPDALLNKGIWAEAGVNGDNVSMSATETLTTNERVLGADPLAVLTPAKGKMGDADYEPERPGGIGEEDMTTIVLPYVHSAREGVLMLGKLLETYGTYEMNGIAFSDVNEIWWLETVGGHHWIARRVPDDSYVTMPNQLGLDSFDVDDALGEQRDHMASADLRSFIADNHLDLSHDGVLNPRDAFGSHSDADHVYNTPRAWDIQRILNPHDGLGHGPQDDDIPWCRVPERKITIEDVKYVLSRHYQGLPYDQYGSGDDSLKGAFRPVGINRNGQLSVVQLRPNEPKATMAIQWVAFGCNVFNVLVPFYANVDRTPNYLANTGAKVTTESFYWANRIVAALADSHYRDCANLIERYQLEVVPAAYERLRAMDGNAHDDTFDPARTSDALAQANDDIAAMLKEKTDDLLDKVLLSASLGMKVGFGRSDA